MKILDELDQAAKAIEMLRKCKPGLKCACERNMLRNEATSMLQPYFARYKTKRQFGKYQEVADALLTEITALI